MQVHNIQSNNYNNYNSPNFKALNVTEAGQKMIESWHGSADKLRKIEIWKKELADTKNFDLTIDELCKDLFMIIDSKNPDFRRNCEAPLRVCDKPKGKILLTYGTDLIDCGDWVTYPLKFASDEEAQRAYNTLKTYQANTSIYTIDRIAWAVDSVKVLEKGFKNPKAEEVVSEPAKSIDKKPKKLPFIQRLKNAWLALKG